MCKLAGGLFNILGIHRLGSGRGSGRGCSVVGIGKQAPALCLPLVPVNPAALGLSEITWQTVRAVSKKRSQLLTERLVENPKALCRLY